MTDYDHWPPIKFRFFGDEDQARGRIPQARSLMAQMIRRMEAQERDNGQWQVQAEDGTQFRVTKMGDVHVVDIVGVTQAKRPQPMRDITPKIPEFARRELLMRPHGEMFRDETTPPDPETPPSQLVITQSFIHYNPPDLPRAIVAPFLYIYENGNVLYYPYQLPDGGYTYFFGELGRMLGDARASTIGWIFFDNVSTSLDQYYTYLDTYNYRTDATETTVLTENDVIHTLSYYPLSDMVPDINGDYTFAISRGFQTEMDVTITYEYKDQKIVKELTLPHIGLNGKENIPNERYYSRVTFAKDESANLVMSVDEISWDQFAGEVVDAFPG